ncbi:hypothetical protein AB3R30_11245 [Leptolyngbyaceae cyanobacterium UHCC 1019]
MIKLHLCPTLYRWTLVLCDRLYLPQTHSKLSRQNDTRRSPHIYCREA